ncbi:ABC transporter substrate-binding protein [Roseovarius sp. M141]|uniref:ABC transporter substrate-binding protein n=1 Tax=Roseovarius sp. M141 TaxID=2583806 RepID=UPI0020CCFA4C|nr:ABC transporter substrate-binding protein [Roseovarius sp. M141]MCQ0093349.1 ABC transporter substrate-binding protein [Roseovarius sp. M141]
MTRRPKSDRPLPLWLRMQAARMTQGQPDNAARREFLTQASAFGVSTGAAYALLGLPAPARAQDTDGTTARTEGRNGAARPAHLRIQMLVRDLGDPRSFDWFQAANVTRGWLEYLVSYENDGTFLPRLLEGWQISDDAAHYTLFVRQGVTWNDGTAFTAQDVARNIARWCDRTAPGNSMAARFAVLIDPETGQAIKGAIKVPDSHTVTLTLPRPDISLIAGMGDYPAAIVPPGFDPDTMLENPVGTGPYLPESFVAGQRAVLVRNDAHAWWNAGNGAWMERIEFIDTGTDPAVAYRAALAGEIDMTHTVEGSYIDVFDQLEGWRAHTIRTASTVTIRANQLAEINGRRPYADLRVRRALQLAMSNEILLELGHGNRGEVAQNVHVSSLQPAYAPMPAPEYDPVRARQLMDQAGMLDFEHELISIDDSWRRNTADTAAALMIDAGLRVRRTILPGTRYWARWNKFPFSTTDWGHRPLAVQTYALAYRSGEPWNEFGWSNPEFDALLQEALATLDIEARRSIMARLETLVRDDAVTVQPYWRTLSNHSRDGLRGGGHHIAFEIRPAELRWT